jgi:hypothetical protein
MKTRSGIFTPLDSPISLIVWCHRQGITPRLRHMRTAGTPIPKWSATAAAPPRSDISLFIVESIYVTISYVTVNNQFVRYKAGASVHTETMTDELSERGQIEATAKRLVKLREALGYKSAAAFAREIGMEAAAYRKYERAEVKRIQFVVIGKIKQETQATADWLLWGDDRFLPTHLYKLLITGADSAD